MADQCARQEFGVSVRPGYEGSNIRSWIGFKHLMYLGEEAVLAWFRRQCLGPQRLYQELGLCLEIADASFVFVGLVEIDDEITAHVVPDGRNRLRVVLRRRRGDEHVVVSKGWFRVALVRKDHDGAVPSLPAGLAGAIVDDLSQIGAEPLDVPPSAISSHLGRESFAWSWRARYFHCHYSDRVQFSAYLRGLEEITDRFLEARGLSIPTMLRERGWIPVVSRARVQMLREAYLDDMIETTFKVVDILKTSAFVAQMDCAVRRGAEMVRTASAQIVHGYAMTAGETPGMLAELDGSSIQKLIGGA